MGRELIGISDDDGSGRIEGNDMYKGKVEPVLVTLFNLYSELNSISVSASRPSSSPVSHCYDLRILELVKKTDLILG